MKHINDVVAICLSVALRKNIDNQNVFEPTQLALAYTELALKQQNYDISASEHFKVSTIVASEYLSLTTTAKNDGKYVYKEVLWSPDFDDFLDRSLLYFS